MSRRGGGVLWTLSVVGVAAWGCGGGGPKTIPTAGGDTFVEGTRLKARWFQLPGARRMFAGWFDSQLGEDCQFEEVASPGLARPAASPLYCRPSLGSASGEVFADAACSQMVADVPCADYHFVQLPPADSGDCTSPGRVFRVGDAVTTGMSYARVEGV